MNTCLGPKNIANKFNEYFTDIGLDLASSIDTSNKAPFDSYLNAPCSNSFLFQYTNPTDIAKIICQLKPKSSAGCDNISFKLLKEITDSISCPWIKIFNQFPYTGIFPSKLKLAKVIPLYKKDRWWERVWQLPPNFLVVIDIENIFKRLLYDYLSLHGLLFDSQYGFRKHHSTELAALELTDRIRHEIDQKKVPLAVFLDLSKAFDNLNHDILLTKPKYHGIKDTLLDWFKNHLKQRLQYVEFDGTASSTRVIETGVHQGPILGSPLFIIYIWTIFIK